MVLKEDWSPGSTLAAGASEVGMSATASVTLEGIEVDIVMSWCVQHNDIRVELSREEFV